MPSTSKSSPHKLTAPGRGDPHWPVSVVRSPAKSGGEAAMKDSGRRLAVLTVGALILFSGGAAGRSSAARSSARAAQSGSIRFSHAVVVDEQRPGFEPDV